MFWFLSVWSSRSVAFGLPGLVSSPHLTASTFNTPDHHLLIQPPFKDPGITSSPCCIVKSYLYVYHNLLLPTYLLDTSNSVSFSVCLICLPAFTNLCCCLTPDLPAGLHTQPQFALDHLSLTSAWLICQLTLTHETLDLHPKQQPHPPACSLKSHSNLPVLSTLIRIIAAYNFKHFNFIFLI